MPGIAIIGDSRNATRNRPTSLPAEARSLSRLLRLLESPATASSALLESLQSFPHLEDPKQRAAVVRVKEQVSDLIRDMTKAGWITFADRYPEYNMAVAVESVLQNPSSFSSIPTEQPRQLTPRKKARATTPSTLEEKGLSDGSSVIPVNSNINNNPDNKLRKMTPKQTGTTQTSPAAASVAVVSDTSSADEDENSSTDEERRQATMTATEQTQQQEQQPVEIGDFPHMPARDIWAVLLESTHLQVASRTTKVWGRKKIYEVYQLANPVQDFAADQEGILRCRLEAEARSLFEGVIPGLSDANHIRVYTTLQPLAGLNISRALYVQINLHKLYDLQDETNRAVSGEKKKKAEKEFVAVLIPGSPFFALTASRAPSRSRYTPYAFAVLERVLTETTAKTFAAASKRKTDSDNQDVSVKRFGDLSGTEPEELLRAARSIVDGEATGRFVFMAAKDQSNPIDDLHTATTSNLLLRPENTSNLEDTRQIIKGARVVAANGDNLWVDHSVKEKQSRKRAREMALGGRDDCPKLGRICWRWSGETTATSTCWRHGNNHNKELTAAEQEYLPKTEFKCAVVMKGDNVLGGIQALIDSGLMEAPLPDFIREAPSSGGTIRVIHGSSFAKTDAPFEEV